MDFRVARYRVSDWLRDFASRLLLMRIALWYSDKHEDVCPARIIPDLGLGYDLGCAFREGISTYRGSAYGCKQDAKRDGSCWCGKHCARLDMDRSQSERRTTDDERARA